MYIWTQGVCSRLILSTSFIWWTACSHMQEPSEQVSFFPPDVCFTGEPPMMHKYRPNWWMFYLNKVKACQYDSLLGTGSLFSSEQQSTHKYLGCGRNGLKWVRTKKCVFFSVWVGRVISYVWKIKKTTCYITRCSCAYHWTDRFTLKRCRLSNSHTKRAI